MARELGRLVVTNQGDRDVQHGEHVPATPGAIPLSTDRTFITSRKAFKMSQTVLDAEFGDFSMFRQSLGSRQSLDSRARPKSAQTSAAAWRAYGSPSVRGQPRPRSAATPAAPPPTAECLPGRLPSASRLGGGFRYPSRSWAPGPVGPNFLDVRGSKTFTRQSTILSAPPQMEHPDSGHVGVFHKALGGNIKFSHTMPTDPTAKQVWSDLLSRAGPATRRVQSARPTRSADSPTRSHRPCSASSASSSDRVRFASAYVYQNQFNKTVPVVTGFSEPEAELVLPNPSDPRFTYSRLGRTALTRLQAAIKMDKPAPASPHQLRRSHNSHRSGSQLPDYSHDVSMVLSGDDPALTPAAEMARLAAEAHRMAEAHGGLDAVSEAGEEAVDVSPLDAADVADGPHSAGQQQVQAWEVSGVGGLPTALVPVGDELEEEGADQAQQQQDMADEDVDSDSQPICAVQQHPRVFSDNRNSSGSQGSDAGATFISAVIPAPDEALTLAQAAAAAAAIYGGTALVPAQLHPPQLSSSQSTSSQQHQPHNLAQPQGGEVEEEAGTPQQAVSAHDKGAGSVVGGGLDADGPGKGEGVLQPDTGSVPTQNSPPAGGGGGTSWPDDGSSLVHASADVVDSLGGAMRSSNSGPLFQEEVTEEDEEQGLVDFVDEGGEEEARVQLLPGAPAANQRYAGIGCEGSGAGLGDVVLSPPRRSGGSSRPMSARPVSRGMSVAPSMDRTTMLDVIEDD